MVMIPGLQMTPARKWIPGLEMIRANDIAKMYQLLGIDEESTDVYIF